MPGCPIMKIPEYKGHPGGETNLQVGRKSTRPDLLFLSYHMGLDLDGRIARQCKEKGVTMPERGPFYNEVHKAVQKVLKENPNEKYVYRGWCLLTTVLLPFLYTWWVRTPSVVNALLLSFFIVTYFFNIFHMRNHKGGMLYHNKFLDAVTKPFYDMMDNTYGVNVLHWLQSHNGTHHLFPNHDELDTDQKVSYDMLRLLPTHPLYSFHKYQWIYAPFIFSMMAFFFPVANISERNGSVFHLITWIITIIVIPFFCNGFTGLAYTYATFALTGIGITYLFSVSHNHPALTPTNECTELGIDDWMKHQINESISWGGYIPTLFFGGINLQVEHHVCPALDSTMYYYVMPELRRICKAHNVNYIYEDNMIPAIRSYHRWLYLMGNAKVRDL